ncbi:MAG: class I SAM-dependent methyltransferase [Candidatus Diapherotrites archaeon]|nr:class I SAM-dependent methyltransferase [Candidatus Diapherotrites archaeon]
MPDYYSETARGYNELHGPEQIKKARLIREKIAPKGLLLDVGAGTGIATREFDECCETIALDPSIGMLEQGKGMRVCSKAEELPFKENTFDCVVSITALHHADLARAWSEIKRVAKPNARVAVSFFKRAGNIAKARELFHEFDVFEEEKDIIFFSKNFAKSK